MLLVQVPTVLFLVSMSWERNAVALWRLVKEFHIFSTCCSRSSLGIWTLFLEPLVLAATCSCALRQSTEAFGRISSFFYVKSGLGSRYSSHLEIWNYFYEQYLAVAFGRTSHIFIVLVVPASLRSSHLKICTLFLLAVVWRLDRFLGGSDAFRAPPGCPGVERQFLEPSMAKSSLPSRAPLANWTMVTWTCAHSKLLQNNNNNNDNDTWYLSGLHLTGKPGAGQGSPLRVAPPVQSDTTVIVTSVQGGAREPQSGLPDGGVWAGRGGRRRAVLRQGC